MPNAVFYRKYLDFAFLCILGVSCKQRDGNSDVSMSDSKRAQANQTAIVSELDRSHASAKNENWFESSLTLPDNWIVQSPKGYGALYLEGTFPRNLECPASNEGCDPQFERKICETDLDCKDSNVSCKPLAASVRSPGEKPQLLCLGPADHVIDHVYGVMTKARSHLDVTSLSSPTGRFRAAVVNALAFLSHQEKVPSVRFLYSGNSPTALNITAQPEKILTTLLSDVANQGGDPEKLRLNLAWLSTPLLSWNHSKIIVADQTFVLSGGHNLWDADYLSQVPVFDISMESSGPVGVGVQKYVNTLWSHIGSNYASSPLKKDRIVPPEDNFTNPAPHNVIGVGRLGVLGDNASDDAIVALINTSKRRIFLSQQDLFSAASLKPSPSWALPALVRAVLRGVTVVVVQSNKGPLFGYGMVSPEDSFKALLNAGIKTAAEQRFIPPKGLTISEYLCRKITYNAYRFNESSKAWPDKSSISNHAKLVIVDDVSFYMGSQNFYPANLQEFGLIVNDSAATRQLLDQYWTPLLQHSLSARLDCTDIAATP